MSQWSHKTQRWSYASLIFITLITAGILLCYIFSSGFNSLWVWYGTVYLALLILNSWYVMVLVLFNDMKPADSHEYTNQLLSVVIPSFNERTDLFIRMLASIQAAEGNKQIIIIDDGSTNDSTWLMDIVAKRSDITLHRFQKNKGKRAALHYAVKNLVDPKSLCVITIDSDTILDRKALVNIAKPLLAPGVGASTGNVLLLNERRNWLTRMTGTYYWMGLNIYKKAQSGIGNVVCCSGCLSGYKTELLTNIIDKFNSQTFLGEKATHSEDRHLTNLILERGYKVVYEEKAICYTETPDKIRDFCKQQLRWKRGFVRESLYTLSYAWRNQRRLFLQILLWDLTAPYLTFGLRLYIFILFVINPIYVLLIVLPLWIAAMVLRYILVIIEAPSKVPGLFIYAIFFELVLYWVNLYALLTVRNKNWVTR